MDNLFVLFYSEEKIVSNKSVNIFVELSNANLIVLERLLIIY